MDQRVYIGLLLRRRQGGGGTMGSDDCAQETNWRGLFQTLFRVRPEPSAKLHYIKIGYIYERDTWWTGVK